MLEPDACAIADSVACQVTEFYPRIELRDTTKPLIIKVLYFLAYSD